MKPFVLLAFLLPALLTPSRAQTPAPSPPAGKTAPRPLFRDPVFDAPTDPVLCFCAEQNKWFMYYTQRRATAINVVELSVAAGKLLPGDRDQPTCIDLKPIREEER
jgi:hypothetical protein